MRGKQPFKVSKNRRNPRSVLTKKAPIKCHVTSNQGTSNKFQDVRNKIETASRIPPHPFGFRHLPLEAESVDFSWSPAGVQQESSMRLGVRTVRLWGALKALLGGFGAVWGRLGASWAGLGAAKLRLGCVLGVS